MQENPKLLKYNDLFLVYNQIENHLCSLDPITLKLRPYLEIRVLQEAKQIASVEIDFTLNEKSNIESIKQVWSQQCLLSVSSNGMLCIHFTHNDKPHSLYVPSVEKIQFLITPLNKQIFAIGESSKSVLFFNDELKLRLDDTIQRIKK